MTAPQGLVISDEVRKKFGPLLELIVRSQSMNNEERQYWINILPVMTPEQTKTLEGILTNERDQLAAIDAKYKHKKTKAALDPQVYAEERSATISELKGKEREFEQTETAAQEELLKKIEET